MRNKAFISTGDNLFLSNQKPKQLACVVKQWLLFFQKLRATVVCHKYSLFTIPIHMSLFMFRAFVRLSGNSQVVKALVTSKPVACITMWHKLPSSVKQRFHEQKRHVPAS